MGRLAAVVYILVSAVLMLFYFYPKAEATSAGRIKGDNHHDTEEVRRANNFHRLPYSMVRLFSLTGTVFSLPKPNTDTFADLLKARLLSFHLFYTDGHDRHWHDG